MEMAEKAAFKNLALQIAISYVANTLSKCEIKVYEKGEEVQNEFYYLLNVSPNPNENASQFKNKLIEECFWNNEALVVLEKDRLYCANSFDVDNSNPLKPFKYSNISFNSQQLRGTRLAGDVFHFKLDNMNVRDLVDQLYAEYSDIISLALQTFKATNGRKYVLDLEQYKAGDPLFNKIYEEVLKNQLKTFVENDNAILPQYKGMALSEFQTTRGNTNDIIAMRKEIFDTAAQAIKIPQSMMYGNITNINDIVKVFLAFAVDPVAQMISTELTRKRYSYNEWQNGSYVEVDTSRISYADILECSDKVDKAIASGITNIDELRPRFRLKPLNTDFSQAHFMTKNYELAENMLKNLEEGEVKEDDEVLLNDEGEELSND